MQTTADIKLNPMLIKDFRIRKSYPADSILSFYFCSVWLQNTHVFNQTQPGAK